MRFLFVAALVAGALLNSVVAYASTVTDTISFVTVEPSPISASYTLVYDPTLFHFGSTGLTLKSSNFPFSEPVVSAFFNSGSNLIIGSLFSNGYAIGVNPGTDSYYLFISNFSTSPTANNIEISTAAGGNVTYLLSSLTVTPVASTPEPSGFVLMVTGFGVLIAATRKRLLHA